MTEHYDPSTGRYITRDPAGFPDGPNNFLHVGNNPINKIDPQGLSVAEWFNNNIAGPVKNAASATAGFVKDAAQTTYNTAKVAPIYAQAFRQAWNEREAEVGAQVAAHIQNLPSNLAAGKRSLDQVLSTGMAMAGHKLGLVSTKTLHREQAQTGRMAQAAGTALRRKGQQVATDFAEGDLEAIGDHAVDLSLFSTEAAVGGGSTKLLRMGGNFGGGQTLNPEAPKLPAGAWHRNAPKSVTPGTRQIDHVKYNPRTKQWERSKVQYDEYGRQIRRTDYTAPT